MKNLPNTLAERSVDWKMSADANRSSMLSIALDASAKKKPIILTSTKTVTTTKTTRHICLGENGEEYQLGLDDLESFLEEEPKKQVVRKKNALKPRLSSNQRINSAGRVELRKRKKKKKLPAIKGQAQQWNESDTETNTTDDEGGHRGLMSSDDKENDEIFSSTINACDRDQPAEANEFWNENSSPTTEPNGRTKKKSKRQQNPNEQKISKNKSKRDINDIVEEALSLPMDVDVTRAEIRHEPRSSPRKLSAIFETSAEATANVTQYPSPPTLDKSPLIEKMVSKHYKEVHNSTPPNISLNETSAPKIASDNLPPSPAVVLPRRTTRVFSSKLIRANLYQDDDDDDGIASKPSKRKKRRNANKLPEIQPLVEIDENPIQSDDNETETAPVASSSADGPKSKTRRNAKKSPQTVVEMDEITIQDDENEIEMVPVASPVANVLKLNTRRKKAIKAVTRPLAVQSKQRTISNAIVSTVSNDLISNTPPAEERKPKLRRKNVVSTDSISAKRDEVVHGNQELNSEEVVTSPIVPNNFLLETPPTDPPKRKNTKKAIKPNVNAEENADQNTNSNGKTDPLARVKKSSKQQVARGVTKNQTTPKTEKSTENIKKSKIESTEVAPEKTKSSPAGVANRATKRPAIATTTAGAPPKAKRGRKLKESGKTDDDSRNEDNQIRTANKESSSSSVQNKNIELNSSAHQSKIPAKIKVKPKRQAKGQSNSKALNESVLFEAPAHNEADQDQLNYLDISTASTVFSGKSKPIIIYSPSRDRDKVKHVDGNRVIIEKSMVAKAIGNPNSGVLIGMTDNGMTIDANERLMYSPREGDEINVKKELKRGVDILNVLAKRRKSVFILQCHSDGLVPK